MSLAKVKAGLSEVVGRVSSQHERVTVTAHGHPQAVIVATADPEALEETIAVLSDPETLHRLSSSDAELACGEGERDRAADGCGTTVGFSPRCATELTISR